MEDEDAKRAENQEMVRRGTCWREKGHIHRKEGRHNGPYSKETKLEILRTDKRA